MSNNVAALLGKALVIWFIVAGISAPIIGRLLARREAQRKLKVLLDRQRQLLKVADSITVDGLFQAVAGELSDRNRFAREAATPMSEREWSDARAWLCDDDNAPVRRREQPLGYPDSGKKAS